MKVCLYLELESKLRGSGIGAAIKNQRKSLELNDVEYTSNLEGEFDILHTNSIGLNSLRVAREMKKKGKKVVMHAHTTADDFRNSYRFSNVIAPFL
ncbi:MAG: glycosyl transferase family 1, partial [Candidatus Altiarchaeota archaeon]|nr:glycosyl transferase family 1 [Candidatus Altiarchaeota archaeon]